MGPGQCIDATHDKDGDVMSHHCTAGKRDASRMQAAHVPQSHSLDGAHPTARCTATATRQGTRPTLYTRVVGLAPAPSCVSHCQRHGALGAAWPSTRRAAVHCWQWSTQYAAGRTRSVDACLAWSVLWTAHALTPGDLATAGDASWDCVTARGHGRVSVHAERETRGWA